jgi:ABC-2 type transport system permease protein
MKILQVARREYIEHVKTRSFIVGIVLLPVILFSSIFIQRALDRASGGDPVVVIDAAGLAPAIREAYTNPNFELVVEIPSVSGVEEDVRRLSARVLADEIDAFMIVEPGVIDGDPVSYYSANVAREQPHDSLLRAVTQAVRKARFDQTGLKPEIVEAVYAPVRSRDFGVGEDASATEVDSDTREAKGFIPMIFVYLMFIGIMGQSQTMLTSTVEEKSNRVMEVLLSSVSPFQLMAGKMIGLGLVSFTLFAVWMAGGAYMIVRNGWEHMVDLSTLGYFMLFFVPGFLLYAAVMAALGSLCNELKEAQNMMTPVMIMMIVPLMTMFWVGQNPDHLLARVLSFIPVFTPFLMINRIASAQPPPMIEVLAGAMVLVLAIFLTVWLASRVFRVGILLYGKPPGFREVLRWMREA